MDRKSLEAAYRSTSFWADRSGGGFAIRVGERCVQLDALLGEYEVSTWAYVTACNPRSQRVPDEVNAKRHANLSDYVQVLEYPAFSGRGKPDAGDWVPEESLLILGIGEEAGLRLGSMLDQNAVVTGKAGEPAKLKWCEHRFEHAEPRPLTQPLPGAHDLRDLLSYLDDHSEEIWVSVTQEGLWVRRSDVPKAFDPEEADLLEGKVGESRLEQLSNGKRPTSKELKLWRDAWIKRALDDWDSDAIPGYAIPEIGRRNDATVFALILCTGYSFSFLNCWSEGLFSSQDEARQYMRERGCINEPT